MKNIHDQHKFPQQSCGIIIQDSLVKENVVLGARAQRLSYGVHFCANVSAIYVSGSRGGREQSGQYGPGVRYVRDMLYVIYYYAVLFACH